MVGGALLLALAFVAQCRAATTHDYSTTTFINTPGIGYLSASSQIKPNSVRYGDTCTDRLECPKWKGFECSQNTCQCAADMPATNQLDKCGPIAQLNEKCDFNEQCVAEKSHCFNGVCECMYDLLPHDVDGKVTCEGGGYQSDSPKIKPNSVKYGDTCLDRLECPKWMGFECSENPRGVKTCQCAADMPATNQLDKCGPIAQLKEKCDFNEQCVTEKSHCFNGLCDCMYDMLPHDADGKLICKAFNIQPNEGFQGNLAMIGVLIGMGLMFIIICIVLRLFSQARWRENRTIFNTPNPRLMNVSLLRENKGGERRGSKGSNHPPVSRQPSLASLRPQSPAQHSQAGSRPGSMRGSRSSSDARSPTGVQTMPHPPTQA